MVTIPRNGPDRNSILFYGTDTDMLTSFKCWNATGYKWLCGAIILAPDIHMDGDDRDRYSVIYTHQTRRDEYGASSLDYFEICLSRLHLRHSLSVSGHVNFVVVYNVPPVNVPPDIIH